MEERTIRELGGEFWSELTSRGQLLRITPFDRLDIELLSEIIDLMMEVLARHQGKLIVNVGDLPVEPLPELLREQQVLSAMRLSYRTRL